MNNAHRLKNNQNYLSTEIVKSVDKNFNRVMDHYKKNKIKIRSSFAPLISETRHLIDQNKLINLKMADI